jgi:hypothetical protein
MLGLHTQVAGVERLDDAQRDLLVFFYRHKKWPPSFSSVSSAFTIIPPSDVSKGDLSLVEMEAAIGELLLSLLGVGR